MIRSLSIGGALVSALASVALLASGCGGSADGDPPEVEPGPPPPPADGLWGRTFEAVSITDSDEPRSLVQNSSLIVSFTKDPGPGQIGWRAGCNSFGAKLRIRGDELRVGVIAGTLIGCGAAQERQDEWLSDFFASDPAWRLRGSELTLNSDDVVVELRDRDDDA
jgi:heat shock protein HslJ